MNNSISTSNSTPKTFKVVLVGDGGVGKSVYLNRIITGDFEKRYLATIGVEIHEIKLGDTVFSCWDTAGQEKFSGLREGYYQGADAAIVMFDVTSRITFENAKKWYKSIVDTCGNIPVVLCGNKVDISHARYTVRPSELLEFIEGKRMTYFDISAKSNFNFDKPFKSILEQLKQ